MNRKKSKRNAAKPKYEPTPQEQTAFDKYRARRAVSPAPRLGISKNENGRVHISADHPDTNTGLALLMDAFGTSDVNFLEGLLGQLANAGTEGGQLDERGLNFLTSLVKAIKPRDELEAMLAAQMAAVHMATMTFAQRLRRVEIILQQDSAERAFNKLARTFATQMEALKRYRTGGEQKVTVQHVSVSEGGQAIVGTVTQAPRETARDKAASLPPGLANSRTSSMPIVEEPASTVVPLKRKPSR